MNLIYEIFGTIASIIIAIITLLYTIKINKTSTELKYNEISYKFIDSFKIYRLTINKNYVNSNEVNINNDELKANSTMQISLLFNSNITNAIKTLNVLTIDIHIHIPGKNGQLIKSENAGMIINQEDIIKGKKLNFRVDRDKIDALINTDLNDKIIVYTIEYSVEIIGKKEPVCFVKRNILYFYDFNKDKIIFKAK